MLSVIILNVIMLNVVVPVEHVTTNHEVQGLSPGNT